MPENLYRFLCKRKNYGIICIYILNVVIGVVCLGFCYDIFWNILNCFNCSYAEKVMKDMKKIIFVIVLLVIAYSYVSTPKTPEETIAKLFSGDLKSAEEVEQFLHFASGEDLVFDKTNYYVFGYNSREDYKNKNIENFLNIDHSENIKVKKLFDGESLFMPLYQVSGSVYLKGNENKPINVNEVLQVGKYNNKYMVSDYGLNFYGLGSSKFGLPHLAIASTDNENIKIIVEITPYYRGNYVAFSLMFDSYTDEELIISDWPDCATMNWSGKTAPLRNVINIDSREVRANITRDETKLRYATSAIFYFEKPISPREAENKLRDSEFKINFIKLGRNGLPVPNGPKYTLRFTLKEPTPEERELLNTWH